MTLVLLSDDEVESSVSPPPVGVVVGGSLEGPLVTLLLSPSLVKPLVIPSAAPAALSNPRPPLPVPLLATYAIRPIARNAANTCQYDAINEPIPVSTVVAASPSPSAEAVVPAPTRAKTPIIRMPSPTMANIIPRIPISSFYSAVLINPFLQTYLISPKSPEFPKHKSQTPRRG